MRKNTTRLGVLATAGAGVAALAVTGLGLPAMADDSTWSTDESTSTTTSDLTGSFDALQELIDEAIIASGTVTEVTPDVSVGDIGGGSVVEGPVVSDSLNGDIGSGNDTPIGSGNDIPVGSGNEVTAPIEAPVGSGNDTSVDAPVGSDNGVGDIGASVDDAVGDIGGTVGDVVDGSIGDLTGDLDLGGLLD